MQRYFVSNIKNNIFNLSENDSYHITKVMRMNIGDKIEIIYNSKIYISEIISLTPNVSAKIIEELDTNNELKIYTTIAQSLVKEQKMDYILQKTVELGVSEIIPLSVDRSIIKISNKETKKIERWQSIVKEASEQSKRNIIPKVNNIMSISNLVKLSDYDIKFLCSVNEKSQNLKKVLSNIKPGVRILFVVGPEGGFASEEEKIMIENNFIPLSLGSSVLRTETASTFIMSIIRYIDME